MFNDSAALGVICRVARLYLRGRDRWKPENAPLQGLPIAASVQHIRDACGSDLMTS